MFSFAAPPHCYIKLYTHTEVVKRVEKFLAPDEDEEECEWDEVLVMDRESTEKMFENRARHNEELTKVVDVIEAPITTTKGKGRGKKQKVDPTLVESKYIYTIG